MMLISNWNSFDIIIEDDEEHIFETVQQNLVFMYV